MTIPTKTALGQEELKRRTHKLGQRHRTILLLVDGRRPLAEVLSLAQQAGAATSHFEDLVRLGLVEVPAEAAPPAEPPARAEAAAPAVAEVLMEPAAPAAALDVPVTDDVVPLASSPEELPPADAVLEAVEVARVPAPVPEAAGHAAMPGPEATGHAITPVLDDVAHATTPVIEDTGHAATPMSEATGHATTPVRDDVAHAATPVRDDVAHATTPVRDDVAHAAPVTAPVVHAAPPVPEPVVHAAPPVPEPVVHAVPPVLDDVVHAAPPVLDDVVPLAPPVLEEAVEPSPSPAAPGPPAVDDVVPVPPPPVAESPPPRELPVLGEEAAVDPLQQVRDLLMDTLRFDAPLFSARMFLRVRGAQTPAELIDLVWEIQEHLARARHAHRELRSLQRARELLGLGNTVVAEDSTRPPMED